MFSRNSRYTSRSNTNRAGNNYQSALNKHFDNINTLAKIIESSQRLLEPGINSQSYFTTRPNQPFNFAPPRNFTPRQETSNVVLHFESLFPNISTQEQTTNDISYNVLKINDTNRTMLDNSNNYDNSNNSIDLFDISQFNIISSPINETCPITQERFDISENVLMIHNCKHIFNKSALEQWIRHNNTCPSCRRNIKVVSS
jgi:hypothetical protein